MCIQNLKISELNLHALLFLIMAQKISPSTYNDPPAHESKRERRAFKLTRGLPLGATLLLVVMNSTGRRRLSRPLPRPLGRLWAKICALCLAV